MKMILDGSGQQQSEHTPIAPLAVEKLAIFGVMTALDESMWQPDSKSEKLIKKAGSNNDGWMKRTFHKGKVLSPTPSSKDILVFVGSFKHGLYGSDFPAIRSVGVIETSARNLMELLVDSSRVKEYNKISLGRIDVIFGQSITKIMRAESKPPMLKPMALTSMLHAKELPDKSGFLIVSRAVHRPGVDTTSSSTKSEIIIGVNLIVDFDDDTERCLMINVNHIYSPMIPLYVAKRVGVSAAHGFINDLRLCV